MKYWDNPEFKAFDVDAYVQDGLVLNYDGIRNAGPGADHDPDAMVWVNCANPGTYDMTRYSTNGTVGAASSATETAWNRDASRGEWTGKGFVFNKNAIFHESESFTIPATYTIQTLVDATAGNQNGIGYIMCDYKASHWADCSMGMRTKSGGGTPDNSFYLVSTSANRPYFTAASASAVFSYATAIHNNAQGVMFPGTKAPWNATDGSYKSNLAQGPFTLTDGISLGGHYPRTDEMFKGVIKNFRFYSKCLSDEEVAWNRIVDDARYFGNIRAAIPATNVVVATAIQGFADDHFAIDAEGFTFTAPEQRTFEGKRYILGGYTLDTWDGAAWVPDGEGTHSGNSVALSGAEAKVRVTWQYSRPAGEGQLKHYDVSDYVTDGLVLFYDGIRNQGAAAPHSYNATTWVNLGNGGSDWTLSLNHKRSTAGAPGYWGDDGFNFLGYSEFKKEGSLPHPATHSIQVLVDVNEQDQIYQSDCAYIYATGWDYSSLAIRTLGNTPKENSLYWCAGGGSAPNRPYVFHSDGHYDYATAIMDGDAKTLALAEGVDIPSSGTLADGFYQSESGFPSWDASRIFLGGYNGSSGDKASLLVGKVKFFRYYPGKALTPAEVAQNRKVDEYRYFGRYTVTNVLVQSTYAYLDGREKAGPYEVDGSYTFTAPETVAAPNGITYACDGYTVETPDGVGWRELASGAGNSYFYETSTGSVRLTWKWKPVSGVRTAADYSLADLSQAGLALHYDGLLNQGIGEERSTTSTKWINLGSRPGLDLTRTTAGSDTALHGYWGEDGYVFGGRAQFVSASGLAWPATFSAQTLVDAKHADNSHASGNYIAATTWSMFGMQIYGAKKTGRFNVQGTSNINLCPNFTTAEGIDYMTAIHNAATKSALAFPGVEAPAGGSAADGYMHFDEFNGIEDNQFRLGGWGGGPNGQNLTGIVKSFRFYDRVLTEEELVRNRNVDSARYFGELAVTNVVVSASGAETAFKVEGAYTFTAPETVEEEGKTVRVAGCFVEELVDGQWKRRQWNDGVKEFPYSEDAAAGKIFRVTWCGPRPGLMLILR